MSNSVGRAFRGLGRAMALGGLAGTLTQAVTQAANFGDKLNRIGINARASEETMRRVGATLRQEASRLNLDIDRVVESYDAWRVASGQSVEAALQSFPAIGEAAKAMNADVATVGAAMGNLAQNLNLSAGDIRITLDQMARAAGDIGIPFEEFARNFGGMSEQMERLGIQGAAGTEQMLGVFTAIQAKTHDANQTFRIMGELMNDLTSTDLAAGRMGQGRVQQIIQDVVANGGNVVDALGRIIEKLYGARMESPRVRAEMEAAFGRDVVNLFFDARNGLIDVEGATIRVRDSAGELGQRLVQEMSSPREPIERLKREFFELLTSLGQVGLSLNDAFGSNNRSLLQQTADDLVAIKNAIEPIASGLSAVAQGNLGEAWEKLSGSEAVKGFFQMPTWKRPAWLGGGGEAAPAGRQAGGPVEAGRPYLVGEHGREVFTPNTAGRIIPDWALRGALGANMVPGVAALQHMKADSESGHPLRTRLRGMLGLEDPGEPAPWQRRDQDEDAPGVVATRANTEVVGESTEQQSSLVEQLTDLNNSLRRLLGLGGGRGGGGEARLMQASFGGGGEARCFGAGAAAGAPAGPWAAAEEEAEAAGRRSRRRRRISGGGATGGCRTSALAAPASRGSARRRRRRSGLRRPELRADRHLSLMQELQSEFGLQPHQAAGLVGNLAYETGGFKADAEGRPLAGRGGYGYAQWTGPRRRAFEAFAAQRGLAPSSHEANVAFLKHELSASHAGFARQLGQTGSVEEASRLTHRVYETPHDVLTGTYASGGGRLNYARQALAGGQTFAPRTVAAAGPSRVTEGQTGATRNLPIQEELRRQLQQAAEAADVLVNVHSGGQPAKGTGGRRTGSTRHDLGGAADVKLTDPQTGRTLDMRNPQDAARMASFTQSAVAAGATGVGAGLGYMGPHSIHVGGGTSASWGGAPWIQQAHRGGMAARGATQAQIAAAGTTAPPEHAHDHAHDHDERAEAERPIPIRFEHQPGETQMRRTSIAREVDRSVREATMNSYADAGFA